MKIEGDWYTFISLGAEFIRSDRSTTGVIQISSIRGIPPSPAIESQKLVDILLMIIKNDGKITFQNQSGLEESVNLPITSLQAISIVDGKKGEDGKYRDWKSVYLAHRRGEY